MSKQIKITIESYERVLEIAEEDLDYFKNNPDKFAEELMLDELMWYWEEIDE